MANIKQGVIIGFLSKTQDRFSEYQVALDLEQKLQYVDKIDGFTGVEMVYPYEALEPSETVALMNKYNLEFAAINVNIKKEAEWVGGALTRRDDGVRARAVDMIKKAKDFAKAVGAPHVTCCPLNDGYDLIFQIDYKKAWNNMVDAVAEAADYLPEIPLFIEPKYSETRVHCQIDSTAKGVLLLKDIACKNVGITLDMGHSLQSQENPAQALSLIYENGFDAYIHTNDNDTKADWDLIGASHHFLQYVETMFWAQEYGYDKYFTTDASPRIFNILDFFNAHSHVTSGVYELAKSLNHEQILALMQEENYSELMKMVNKSIYRL
ncbi:MAG: sugar phosphate isomerase/epimerase family protein [Rikenellaceae bacterium]